MRIQQLRLLLAIAETGSLRASARALSLTQPALTKSLRLLEDELGVPLVVRSPHGARLAPAGELGSSHPPKSAPPRKSTAPIPERALPFPTFLPMRYDVE